MSKRKTAKIIYLPNIIMDWLKKESERLGISHSEFVRRTLDERRIKDMKEEKNGQKV